MTTFYCSSKCQKNHWNTGGHKEQCVPIAHSGSGADGGAAVEEEADFICAICMEPLSQSPSQILSCSHEYHRDCVSKLQNFGLGQPCPMCRMKLPPGPDDQFADAVLRWLELDRKYMTDHLDDKFVSPRMEREILLPWRTPIDDCDVEELEEVLWVLHEAADQGNLSAQHNIGVMYYHGQSLPKKKPEAAQWFRRAGIRGHAESSLYLFEMYVHGEGVGGTDPLQAFKWARLSGDQGNVHAQAEVGIMYSNGLGVKKDDVTAMQWLSRAAGQGNTIAIINLGAMYAGGKGVAGGVSQKNDETAVEWYLKCIEIDPKKTLAYTKLGVHCLLGKGVPKDSEKAVKWFRKAAETGDLESQKVFGTMLLNGEHGIEVDFVEAVMWLQKAADRGSIEPQYNLGKIFSEGHGEPDVKINLPLAVEYYRKAAAQGCGKSMNNLGVLYYTGRGVPRDLKEAIRWVQKARDNGCETAAEGLKVLISELGRETNREKRREKQTTSREDNNGPTPTTPASDETSRQKDAEARRREKRREDNSGPMPTTPASEETSRQKDAEARRLLREIRADLESTTPPDPPAERQADAVREAPESSPEPLEEERHRGPIERAVDRWIEENIEPYRELWYERMEILLCIMASFVLLLVVVRVTLVPDGKSMKQMLQERILKSLEDAKREKEATEDQVKALEEAEDEDEF